MKRIAQVIIIGNVGEDEEKAEHYLANGWYHCIFYGLNRDKKKFKMIAEKEV